MPDGIRLVAVNKVTTTEDVSEDLVWLEKQVEAQRLALDLEMALLEAIDQSGPTLRPTGALGEKRSLTLWTTWRRCGITSRSGIKCWRSTAWTSPATFAPRGFN